MAEHWEPDLPETEKELCRFLVDINEAFSLEEGERGDASPVRQQLGRMRFAARQEVARQLNRM